MSVSAFGVDHGDIYKAYDPKTGKKITPQQEKAKHYGRMAALTGGIGGTSAALGAPMAGIAMAERKGKDPMGFAMRSTPYARAHSAKARTRILHSNAVGHTRQAVVAGGLAAGGLGLAGAYHHAKKKELAKALSERTKANARDTGAAGLGVGAAGAGGYTARILGEHSAWNLGAAKEAHGYLKEHKTGDVKLRLTPKQVGYYQQARKVRGGVGALKGAGALAAGGIGVAGLASAAQVGRNKLAQRKAKP